MKFLSAIFGWTLNLLFPPHCVFCKEEGDFLCKKCVQSFVKRPLKPFFQKRTDQPKEFQYLDGVIYALDYAENPAIQAAIEQFKYRFNQELAAYFGELLAEKVGELEMVRSKPIDLIPVPLHQKRLHYRGFNQAEVIARSLTDRLNRRFCITPFLERVKPTEQQAKLSREERQKNMEDAFQLNKFFVQKTSASDHVSFLVDDVCTTGATLENCAKVLKANGFKKIYGLVVARAFK